MPSSLLARSAAAFSAAIFALALVAGTGGRPAAAGAGAVHFDGFVCFIQVGSQRLLTTDSRVTATPSGNSHLVCHFDTGAGPATTLVAHGFPCTTADRDGVFRAGGTGHFVWTPSGQATAT